MKLTLNWRLLHKGRSLCVHIPSFISECSTSTEGTWKIFCKIFLEMQLLLYFYNTILLNLNFVSQLYLWPVTCNLWAVTSDLQINLPRRTQPILQGAVTNFIATFCQILHIPLVGHIFLPFSSPFWIYNNNTCIIAPLWRDTHARIHCHEDLGCFCFFSRQAEWKDSSELFVIYNRKVYSGADDNYSRTSPYGHLSNTDSFLCTDKIIVNFL